MGRRGWGLMWRSCAMVAVAPGDASSVVGWVGWVSCDACRNTRQAQTRHGDQALMHAWTVDHTRLLFAIVIQSDPL